MSFLCKAITKLYYFSLKVRRSRASSDSTLLASKMIKSLPSPPAPDETFGSAAVSRTSSPVSREEKSTSRTLTTTHPPLREPTKLARSTPSLLGRTCVGGRLSFMTCLASLCSRWSLTCTRLRAACSATVRQLMDLEDPNRRRLTTGSSCQEDSATLYQCPHNCLALRSFTSQLLLAPTIMVLLPAAPVSCPRLFQVSSKPWQQMVCFFVFVLKFPSASSPSLIN